MSKTKVPAIPSPTDSNLRDVARAVKSVLDVREGLAGDPLDKSVTFRDLVDGGFADPLIISRGGGSGSISISPSSDLTAGGTGGGSSEEPDLTPPPQPTGLTAAAGLAVVILEWDAPVYGNHAFTEIWRADTNVIGNAERVGTTPAAMYNDAIGVTGATRYYWIRHRSTADVVGPYNSTNGTVATTGKIGNVDLGPLIVEAANLANGSVSATKLAAQAVELTKFANGIEPVTVVAGSTVPTVKSTNTIYLDGTGKLYRWNGTAYVASVPTTDLTGTVASSQIADNAIITAKIADAALTTAKFASTIEPLTIVTGALPTTKSTNTIFRTDDSKTYRWNGSAYVASVATADLTGTISDAQIAGLAASKITGQLSDTQIADVAAAKVTGQLVATQIADATLTTAKFASTIEPVTIVTGPLPTVKSTNTIYLTSDGKIYRWNGTAYTSASGISAFSELTGSISASQIPDATITSAKIADAAVTTAKFASTIEPLTIVTGALPTTKSTNTIYRTDDSKVYRWNGTAYVATVPTADLSGTVSDAQIAGLAASKVTGQLTDTQIADVAAAKVTGQLVSSQIADAAITTAKFASSIEPVSVVSSVPGTLSTRTVFNTTDGKLYRWNGSSYVATVPTADLSGTVSDAQIAGLAASKVTGQLTNSQIADVAAAKVTGQFVSSQIADAAITTAKFASGISPIEIVAALPSTGNFAGRVAFLTADNKLYRHNGTAWIATVASSDISGTISDAQIAGLAASKVTGQLSDSQLAAISAAKISGQLSDTQLAAISAAKVTGTIASTQIADDAITTPKIFAGAITTAKIAASAVTAGEIAAGAITTVKLAASAVTANEIAAGAVIADKIASNAVTTAKLDAAAVTAAKIAAGTITASEIASSTITGGNIAANTITSGNIAADTITAGNIAAGAIGAAEVAASAITTDKLFVTGRGSALNDDPFTSDTQAWLSPGLWSAFWSIVNITDGPSGKTAIRATSGTSQSYAGSRQVAFNPNKAYRVRAKVRSNGSDGVFYLVVDLRDVNGTVIGGDGTAWFYPVSGATVPTSWTDYEGKFGFGTDRPFPANAKTMSVGALMNYNATTGYHEVQDLRIEEMADASLIVDGAIVASKIAANAVTTAKLDAGAVTAAKIAAGTITANEIASGAITTAKLVAGAVTANEIASATITGGNIAGSTITGSNIAADTITAGQIAAGAIGASEIAAGSITTSKLLVTGEGKCINPDPTFADNTAWTNDAGTITFGSDATSPASGRFLRATGATRFYARTTPIEGGKQYKVSMWARKPTGSGLLYIRLYCYDNDWNLLNYVVQALSPATGTFEGLSTTYVTGSWTKYTGYITANAGTTKGTVIVHANWDGDGYTDVADLRSEEYIGADLIVDGAITTDKLSANAVTAGKIAANTITASQIAGSTITGANIAGGTITGANIAAGTVQASNIAASTITGDKIAGNTITGSNIAADTITAGQIAAGAIGASEVAAGAITTAKLLVSGQGAALNPDPSCSDESAWVGGPTMLSGLTDSPSGGTAIANEPGVARNVYSHAPIPIEPNKKYRLEVWVKQQAGSSGVMYAGVMWCDATGNILNNLTPAGWSNGTYSYMPNVAYHAPTFSWVRHTFAFGPGEVGGVPSNAKFVRLFLIFNYLSDAGAQHAVTGFKLMEKSDGDLIVDGAITASKIQAGTITGDRIAGNTITGTNIAGSTITGSNIAGDTITAGQIAAGAIGASEIAANAITASKIVIANRDDISPDPGFHDPVFWGWTSDNNFEAFTGTGSAQPRRFVRVYGGMSVARDYITQQIPVEAGASYRIRVRLWVSSSATGWLSLTTHLPDVSWYSVLPNNGTIDSGTWPVIDLASSTIPKDVWNTYTGTITFQANTQGNFIQFRHRANIVNSYVEFAWEVVRAGSADLIVDGAITTDKLSANAVTAAKIAANTITASQIASSTITGTNIAGGTITGSNIAAGTVQATNIAGSTITGDKIAGNTITGSNIAADTITAGQIAAGAIGASEVSAGAITTQKLLVAPVSLCPDPYFTDIAWWTAILYDANGWYFESGTSYTNTPVQAALWSGHPTNAPGANRKHIWSGNVTAPAIGTNLRLRARMRNDSNQIVYVTARFHTTAGVDISDISLVSQPYSGLQTLTTQGVVPNDAAFIRFIIFNEANNTFSGAAGVSAVMLDVAASADLVVDGAITTDKLSANAVTAAKIQAGTITGDRIAGSTITGTNIAGSTITGSNIVGDTITAGNIAAGAIGASEIAAGAVTASKLLVTGPVSLLPDGTFEDQDNWGITYGGSKAQFKAVSDAPAGRYVAYSPPGASAYHVGWNPGGSLFKTIPVDKTKRYRFSFWWRVVGATSGSNQYATVAQIDADGNLIGTNGGHLFYVWSAGVTAPNSWQRVDVLFGAGSSYELSANCRLITPSFLFNWEVAGGEVQIADVRIVEAVDASLIVDGAIIASKLSAGAIAVGSAAIANGAISNAMLGSAVVDSAKIADAAITNAKIGNAAIDTAKIGDGQITTAKIGDAQITIAKIADTIQSTGYSASGNGTGWRISKDGTAQFAGFQFSLTQFYSNNYSSGSAGFAIANNGFAEFNNVALRGAINGGAYTGYAWPASGGTGFHLGPSGLLLGNANDGRYFQVGSNGDIYAPGFTVVSGAATFSGSLSAATGSFSGSLSAATGTFSGTLTASAINAVGTINIAGQAVSITLSSSGTGATISTSLTVPTGETYNIVAIGFQTGFGAVQNPSGVSLLGTSFGTPFPIAYPDVNSENGVTLYYCAPMTVVKSASYSAGTHTLSFGGQSGVQKELIVLVVKR